ncbi:MAG: photosystem II reaction center phosphoprotein PsbH [Elainellaceae cyanobacterium]
MQQKTKYVSKKAAPLQYFLRQFNSESGRVAPGWGTVPLMAALMVFFFIFLLMILQIYNQTILLN